MDVAFGRCKCLIIVCLLCYSCLFAWGDPEVVRTSAESLTDAAIATRTWEDSKYKYSINIHQSSIASVCIIEFYSEHHYSNLYLCDAFLVFDNNENETHPACLVIERSSEEAEEFSVDKNIESGNLGSSLYVCMAGDDENSLTCKTLLRWHCHEWLADNSFFYILGERVIFRYSLHEGGVFETREKRRLPFGARAVHLHIKYKE